MYIRKGIAPNGWYLCYHSRLCPWKKSFQICCTIWIIFDHRARWPLGQAIWQLDHSFDNWAKSFDHWAIRLIFGQDHLKIWPFVWRLGHAIWPFGQSGLKSLLLGEHKSPPIITFRLLCSYFAAIFVYTKKANICGNVYCQTIFIFKFYWGTFLNDFLNFDQIAALKMHFVSVNLSAYLGIPCKVILSRSTLVSFSVIKYTVWSANIRRDWNLNYKVQGKKTDHKIATTVCLKMTS